MLVLDMCVEAVGDRMAQSKQGGKSSAIQQSWISLPRQRHGMAEDSLGTPQALEGFSPVQLLAICSGPGMGKTFIANKTAIEARDRGYRVITAALENLAPDVACKRLVRISRDALASVSANPKTLVVVDGIAPGDEAQIHSEAGAIGRLVDGGCQVLLCVRPESEQLVEALHGAVVVRTDELVFRSYQERSKAYELTGGIPSLVAALRSDAALGEDAPETGARYTVSLQGLLGELLNKWLPEEEFRARLAMMLLGQGSMEDVALVAGRCDAEQLTWLNHDTPFFGIDLHDKTFCCHGICDDDVFNRCSSKLHTLAAGEAKLVSRACGMLVSRGKIGRSATVCALCSDARELAAVSIAWGVDYIEAGALNLVESALQSVETSSEVDQTRLSLTNAALCCVARGWEDASDALGRTSRIPLETSTEMRLHRHVRMLGCCRMLWRNPWRAYEEGAPHANDSAGIAGADHLAVCRALYAGRFGEAYAQITSGLLLKEPNSLFDAFLCDDMMLSLAMLGGAPDQRERNLISRAEEFFKSARMPQIGAYHRACVAMPKVLMSGVADSGAIEDAAIRAERLGDTFLQAVFLTVAAVSDLHMRALSRAHVRAARAAAIARDLDMDYLRSSAELVDAATLYCIGERNAFGRYCSEDNRPECLLLLARMARDAAKRRAEGETVGEASLVVTPLPRDALWVVNMLLCDCGPVSEDLKLSMPASWIDVYHSMRVRHQQGEVELDQSTLRASAIQVAEAMRTGVQEEILPQRESGWRIHIGIFGTFGVKVDGKRLPDSSFSRRRSRDLLMLLALAPLHRMPRYQIIDMLWPGEDYIRGPRKLYEATGEARKQLLVGNCEANPLMADKAQGSVGLNTSIVSCDIDEFTKESIATVSEDGDDYAVLEHARRMEQVYAGGPDTHVLVLGQRVVERVEEIKSMYVDGLVAAGEAALRLNKGKLAVRYAQEAHRLIELREDAVILLVHALRATGRAFEIPGVYRRFARRLIESQGVPPSTTLRHAVDAAMGGGFEPATA